MISVWQNAHILLSPLARNVHRKKKVRKFPVPSRDVTTKLSLGGNNDIITELFLPRGSLVSDIPAGDGKLVNLFLRCGDASVARSIRKYLAQNMQTTYLGLFPRFIGIVIASSGGIFSHAVYVS